MNTNLLTKKQKCEELGISRATLDRWRAEDKIDTIRVKGSKRPWFLPARVDEEI